MEQPKRKNFEKAVQPIDGIARSGHFKEGDLPGIDTYDDGLNERGEVVMPGSTATGSGANYMEDTGPNDLRRRNEEDEMRAREGGLNVAEPDELTADPEDMYAGKDAAAEWLRQNDPDYRSDKRKAA